MLGAVDRETETAAIKLVGIHGKIWGGTDAKRQFEFVLPRSRSMCSDFYTVTQAGDKLAYVWKRIRDAGQRESILDFSTNVYDISHAVYIGTGERSVKCSDLWIAYALRMQGKPVASSKEHVMRGGILSAIE